MGDESKLTKEQLEALERLRKLRAERKPIPGHKIENPEKFSMPLSRATDPRVANIPRRDRIVGAVLGAAIGDALGYPVEFIESIAQIRAKYGPQGVTGYVHYIEDRGRRVAPYSDDTQMAEVVLRSLLWSQEENADLDRTMRHMGEKFVAWARDPQGGHRAPGNACLAGCRALAQGAPWDEAGGSEAGGCGSVMRAYPFGLMFADDHERAVGWAVAHSKLTHRDPIALAACAAMADGVFAAVDGRAGESIVEAMSATARHHDEKTADMIADATHRAFTGETPEAVLSRYLGWAAHDAIAAATYVFARHPNDPRTALLEAANSPGDSDSIATLVGALVGARCGVGALPAEWVRDLERSDELLALAETVAAAGK
ncbi:MAG: ADP-ribosylglycohydrolase family protein [Polyangiaceae bacterium]